MPGSATARAQADEALEQAAVALKRSIGASRKALQSIRQAQVNQLGVSVKTTALGGTDHGDRHEDSALT